MDGFNFFTWLAKEIGIKGDIDIWWLAVLNSLLVSSILCVFSVIVWMKIKWTDKALVPSKGINLQNTIELLVEWLFGIMRPIMGDRAEKFLPLIGTLFIYILCCNLLGVIPGFLPPTAVITTNFACAAVVFFYYNFVGMKELGMRRYMKGFLGPVIWLAPMFIIVELTTHLSRPISLSIRLYGNIVGDELILRTFTGLVPLLIPIFFIILGIFAAFIQAFVFAILSAVYIALAAQDG